MSEEQVTEPMQTAGQMLRKAREAKGLSISDMAKALRLNAIQIENLEADQFLSFKTPTFVRGYLRAYAKQVNIDETTLFQVFEQQDNRKPDVGEMRSFSHQEARKRGDKGTLLIGVCVILVVAFGVFGWIYQNGAPSVGGHYQDQKADVTNAVSSSDAAPSTVNSDDATEESPISSSSAEVNASDVTLPEVNEATTEQAAVAATEIASTAYQNTVDSVEAVSESTEQALTDSSTVASNETQTLQESAEKVLEEELPAADTDVTEESARIVSSDEPLAANSNELVATELDREVLENNQRVPEDNELANTESTESVDQSVAEENEPLETNNVGVTRRVELRFSNECWAKVVDATGETLVLGVKGRGHVSSVEGVSPFQILLGNPDVVELYLDGEIVSKPDTPRGAIAKFNLPIVE